MPVGALSGGNQQKVLLSRLLETQPKVLILDEPTRGVDIGAKSEIYRIIDELAQGGAAVLVISSELPEVVGIADRVVVMREGETRGRGRRRAPALPITEENIMALATGVEHGQGGSMSESVTDSKPPVPTGQRARKAQMRGFIRSIGMLPVLIILGILIQVGGIYFTGEGRFLSWQNLSIVAQQASINAVLGGRHDVRDPDRRHRPVGRLDPGGVGDGRVDRLKRFRRSRHPGGAADGAADRPRQRRADRVPAAAAVHRDARLADRGARLRAAARQRHHGVQPQPAVRLHRQRRAAHRRTSWRFPG